MTTLELLKERKLALQLEKLDYKQKLEKKQKHESVMKEGLQLIFKLSSKRESFLTALKILKDQKIKKREDDSSLITDTLNDVTNSLFPGEDFRFKFLTSSRVSSTGKESNYTKLVYNSSRNNDITKNYLMNYCNGRGLRQVASFIITVKSIALSNTTPFILLDECFNSLSKEEANLISEFIAYLAESEYQFVIIEHAGHIFKHIKYKTYKLKKVYSKEGVFAEIEYVLNIDKEAC